MIRLIRANIVPALLILLLLIVAASVSWNLWQGRQTAKTEAGLSRNQAGAAVESGRDAVDTVGNRMDADAALDSQTRKNDADIRQIPGASATVAPVDRDAFLRVLCRSPGRSSDPKCVQLTDPR